MQTNVPEFAFGSMEDKLFKRRCAVYTQNHADILTTEHKDKHKQKRRHARTHMHTHKSPKNDR